MKLLKTFMLSSCLLGVASLCADTPLTLTKEQVKAAHNAKVNLDGNVIHLNMNNAEWSCGTKIVPLAPNKFLDLSAGRYLVADVENISDKRQMRLTMHVLSDSKVPKALRDVNTGIGLNPGEKRTMKLMLPHDFIYKAPENGHGMKTMNTKEVTAIEFKMQWPNEPGRTDLVNCKISNLRLEGEPDFKYKVAADKYNPFVDQYGQFVHGQWAEKINSDDDLKKAHAKELAELDATPNVPVFDRFGGFADGPKVKATGFFRTTKHNNKWYLVTPDGTLFWSLGIDVLRSQTDAMSTKHPEWVVAGVQPEDNAYQFTHWSLQKKYGKQDYKADFYQNLVKRLDAWGINTIGNWGHTDLMSLGKKPYTLSLGDFTNGFPKFQGSKVKFYDVYDPQFEIKMGNLLRDRAKEDPMVEKSINDPMCIGYFIDNELKFDAILGAVLKAPATQAAKIEFIRQIQAKYPTVEDLNKSWGTDFKSFDDINTITTSVKNDNFKKDAAEYLSKFVDRYFQICRQGVKSVAPHRLYMGPRFVGFRQAGYIWAAAAKHCDVLSVNSYMNSIYNVNSGDFRDKPLIIGEFHFGAYDRGMFSPSLCPVYSQEERATSYKRYVQGALAHPNIVGAHYFQFRDQPLTGRFDGEGYQIGFVDIADTPYPEMTKAAREVGENMYQYRERQKLVNDMK